MLQLPAHESGTGDFNREHVYLWRDGWGEADVTGWLEALPRRLPKGDDVRKGVYPDYAAMTAETPVWRRADGENCPTGGRAVLKLAWKGDQLAMASVRLSKAGDCGAPPEPHARKR